MNKKKKSLLWAITSPTNNSTSYLFGTIHVWDDRAVALIEKVMPMVEKCDVYCAETQLDNLAQLGATFSFLPDDKTIKDFFEEKKYIKIRKMVEKVLKTPFQYVERLQPMILANLLSATMIARYHQVAMDELLWKKAIALGKEMVGVESAETQIEIFQKIGIESQCEQLLGIVKNMKKNARLHRRLSELYAESDIHALYIASKKSLKGLRKPLLYDRNKKMVIKMETLMANQSVFVAVGAGHLAGEKGIIHLLKKKGYTVDSVNN